MIKIDFSPEAWTTRCAGFPRLAQSVLFDISMHNWRTGAAMSLSHFRLITSDIGDEQALAIADMLMGAGKIDQGEDGSIWSPDAIEEHQRAARLRDARSRGGTTTAGVKKPRKPEKAKPAPAKKSQAKPAAPAKIDVQPAPVDPATEDAVQQISAVEQAKATLADNVKRLGEAWNAMASRNGLAQIEKMTEARAKGAGARIKEFGIERLLSAIETIPQSEFLMGKNGDGWKMNFDTLIRPERCAKLVEGGYHITGPGNEKQSGWR